MHVKKKGIYMQFIIILHYLASYGYNLIMVLPHITKECMWLLSFPHVTKLWPWLILFMAMIYFALLSHYDLIILFTYVTRLFAILTILAILAYYLIYSHGLIIFVTYFTK